VIYVAVDEELINALDQWSPPVEVMIEKTGNEWQMVARKHACPVDNPVDNEEASDAPAQA
jgi:hypothetical protein